MRKKILLLFGLCMVMEKNNVNILWLRLPLNNTELETNCCLNLQTDRDLLGLGLSVLPSHKVQEFTNIFKESGVIG